MSSQLSPTKAKFNLSYVHMAVIFFLMFGFGYLPTIGTITPIGMKILGIFIGLLYGWSTCGMLWPSLLGMFALGFSGMGSVKEMLAMCFSNDIVIFLLFILILVEMINQSGAANAIVNFFITRKVLQGRPWLFSFVFLLSAGLLCTFGQAFVAYLLCWGLLQSLALRVGYKPYDAYPTIMIIGVVISSAAIGMMVPFKGTPLLLLGAYTGITQLTVNYLQYMLVMIPAGLLFLICYLFFCRLIIKPNMAPMHNMNVDELIGESSAITKRQKASLLAFGFFLLLLLIPGCLPTTWPFVAWLNRIGNSGMAIFCTVLFTLIHVEGEPLLDYNKLSRTGMNWPIVFMVAVLMAMTSLLMNDATGIKTFLLTIMQPLLAHCSGFTLLILLLLLGTVMTNFMNNMVVGFMLIPILVAISSTIEVNVVAGVLMIIVACNAAFLTPAASPAAAMLFAKKDWLHGQDIVKIGAISIVILLVLGSTIVFGLGSLLF